MEAWRCLGLSLRACVYAARTLQPAGHVSRARLVASPNQAPRGAAGVLRALVTLHALRRLEADLGFLLTEGLLPLDTGRAIPGEIRCLHSHAALLHVHRPTSASPAGIPLSEVPCQADQEACSRQCFSLLVRGACLGQPCGHEERCIRIGVMSSYRGCTTSDDASCPMCMQAA